MEAKIKKSVLIYISIFLILSIAIFFLFEQKKEQNKQIYLNQKIVKAAAEFKATLNGYKMVIEFIQKRYFSDEKFLKLLYLIEKAPVSERSKLRKLLSEEYKDLYKDMQRYGIKFIQVKLPDGTVFLRFHRPEKFGDNQKKEEKINIIFETEKKEKFVGGFKFPYELYYKDKFLGTVEIILSYEALKDQLRKIFQGEYVFLIYKEVLFNVLSKGIRKTYIQSEFDENFYYESSDLKSYAIPPDIFAKINLSLKEKIKNRLEQFSNFAVDIKIDGNYYVVSFIVIKNITGKKVGYLVYYEKDNTISIFNEAFIIMYLSVEFSILAVFALLINIIKRSERFKTLSETDPLTGIYNKGKFNRILEEELKKVKRYGRPLGLIIFDIDHFKKINDTYGHQVGDYVLKTIAKIVKENIRDTDVFARWGGEEFVIIAPETDISGTRILAEKLRKKIEEYNFDKVGKVTSSFGVTEATPEDTPDSIVKRADQALYLAKEKGRNRVEVILPEI
ncbi:diguanylate cyclase [Persephonella sp. KM09-Lau-8]|uniref:sensor domain-containing diguanylate cyclase n=1 Tax=Persephonella sp. KM09-Lau-8 TaxID=1158345 RepID=UPI00068F8FA0|nr:diguanylate cyclase [Persephonella sp. KM09-Lau-8]